MVVGRRGDRSIAYAAQAGTATTPAGFRAAARVVRLADAFELPLLPLIDTPSHEQRWITPDAYFSVTSPDGATAILKRDAFDIPRVARELRVTPADLLELGVVAASPAMSRCRSARLPATVRRAELTRPTCDRSPRPTLTTSNAAAQRALHGEDSSWSRK